MTLQQIGEFMTKCANIPYKDYSWLKGHCYRTLNRPCSPNARNEHLAVLDLINEHEERRWIPVSERLPEPDVEVLVTDDAGGLATISTDSIYESEATGEKEWYTSQRVTAWMPLPEPYKPESEEGS